MFWPWIQEVAESFRTPMTEYFRSLDDLSGFSSEQATKVDVLRGQHLFVGLNCFEPGQSQKTHVHAGSDKFYVVLSGKARMIVGDEIRVATGGTVVWAPADLPHGVVEALERTVMLVAMAPPPGLSRRPAP
jgi:quercetin dioxygenase-like cupin family protein